PGGRVLLPAADTAWRQFSEGWEEETAGRPVRVHAAIDASLEPRALIAGIEAGGVAKAYPMDRVRAQAPIHDRVGGVPVVILLGPDGKSVRAFESRLDTLALEFLRSPDGPPGEFLESATGSRWSFQG